MVYATKHTTFATTVHEVYALLQWSQVRTIPRANLPPAFTTGGSAKNLIRTGKSRKEVRVPKFRGTKADGPAPIDFAIMRRKREAQIQDEQAVNREKMDHYRPPYIKPIGNDEKLRLAEKFEFGGGKALPPEMTGPTMPIPSEERWKHAEKKRIVGVIRRRKGLCEEVHPEQEGSRGEKRPTTMFDQVADEIEERQQFLAEARASGVPFDGEARVMAEISQRMSELKRLTPPSASS